MTQHLTEIGKDGRGILWQSHLLTDVMETHGAEALIYEPVLIRRGEPSAARLKVVTDSDGLSWKWGEWKKLQITDGRGVVQTYSATQRPSVLWADLPACDTFDLIFYDADAAARGAVKISVPRGATFNRDVNFVQRGDAVVVSLLNRVESARVSVEVLEPGQTRDAALGQEGIRRRSVTFQPGEASVRVPLMPFTIIAAVRHSGGRRDLLGYVSYNGRDQIAKPNLALEMDAKLLEKVCRWVGEDIVGSQQSAGYKLTPEEWLDNWPQTSRQRLVRLAEQSRAHLGLSEAEAVRLLRDHPAGLARLLVLTICGYTQPNPEQSVRSLDDGSFQAALGVHAPRLAAALVSLSSPVEKCWAVRHAHNLCLGDAVVWAGSQGAHALSRALHLFEIRAEAIAAWEARSRPRAAESVTS